MASFLFHKTTVKSLLLLVLLSSLAQSCQEPIGPGQIPFSLDYEKYTLENGLQVILHIDRSDPIVAVAMTYHVGSARERPGKTGFAHLFEHLLFLDSENLGPKGIDTLIDKVGGSMNGSTSRDRTNYYQVVPSDALEKILWAESDRMGFFINTVTKEIVEKEKQIVKNEKRQTYDNQPGGQIHYLIDKNLYPPAHPYHWQTIGSLEDLDTATLQDARAFYKLWYGPNNATLVVAGDFDPDQTRRWVAKYFGEIQSTSPPPAATTKTLSLTETKRLFYQDNLASVPTLTMTWPTVKEYHPDSYPLELLAALLSEGKRAPLYVTLVDEEKLAPSVDAYYEGAELAGKFNIWIESFAGTNLNQVHRAIDTALKRFELEGFTVADLDRVKARRETSFYDGYNGISSVLGKAFALAKYNIFAGDPGYIAEDIARMLTVKPEDVFRVYEVYVRGKHFVTTSNIPMGKAELALEHSVRAHVMKESIIEGREPKLVASTTRDVTRTPSLFDRSVEPPLGPAISLRVHDIWNGTLKNGVKVFGIEQVEVPIVRFTIRLKGGLLLDNHSKVGVANLVATTMTEGTAKRTPEELTQAIDTLGSSINVSAGRESLRITGKTLKRHYDQTMALVEEILLEPRWSTKAFLQARQSAINKLIRQAADPGALATNTFNRLLYAPEDILSENILGTVRSLESITIDDLRNYYQKYVKPGVANIHIVGDVSKEAAIAAISGIGARWEGQDVDFPPLRPSRKTEATRLFFVDIPEATQSVIRIGAMRLAETDPDFFPATVMNLRLGGAFVSRLNQVLREEKAYTYGIISKFAGTDRMGPFTVSTMVRTNVTLESVRLIHDILSEYATDFNEIDLNATKEYLIRSNARAFETLASQIRMLEKISSLRLPVDYIVEREQIVQNMTLERVRELARRYVDPEQMIVLVVGNRRTQFSRLSTLGLGTPILLNPDASTTLNSTSPER